MDASAGGWTDGVASQNFWYCFLGKSVSGDGRRLVNIGRMLVHMVTLAIPTGFVIRLSVVSVRAADRTADTC